MKLGQLLFTSRAVVTLLLPKFHGGTEGEDPVQDPGEGTGVVAPRGVEPALRGIRFVKRCQVEQRVELRMLQFVNENLSEFGGRAFWGGGERAEGRGSGCARHA